MSLIRHFQPTLCERYQQELREWEVATTKNNKFFNVTTLEKPPMIAFCLKLWGLEVPISGSKIDHKRTSESLSQGIQTASGRRLNGLAFGDEKFAYPGHFYDSPFPQISQGYSHHGMLAAWDIIL